MTFSSRCQRKVGGKKHEIWQTAKKKHKEYKANMKIAVEKVVTGELKLRAAANFHQISKSALHRMIVKYKNINKEEQKNFDFERKHGFGNVFDEKEEQALAEYLIKASQMCYGLTVKATSEFAYQFAVANDKTVPQSWIANKRAGLEWIRLFRKRQPTLSLRTPEATSLSRATSFNKHNVSTFFHNLQQVLTKHKFDINQIYNCDETAVTTVHRPPKIIATTGQKQVGKVTSAERGILVTMCVAICANGSSIPPFFVFPRQHFKAHMLNGAPPGSKGAAHKSGWMTSENFVKFLEHLVNVSRCNVNNKILLILDNHESHCDFRVIHFCKQNGVVLLTLPPHCSHRLQPLDISCFGPFKAYYNREIDEWMLNHPGTPLNIYNIAEITGMSFHQAFVPSNIIKGFERTGIYPYNSNVFQESDFMSSYVTDRPNVPELNETQPSTSKITEHTATPSTSKVAKTFVTPEELRPHVKAKERKETRRGRKRAKSTVLTDTPNMEEKAKSETE